MKRTILFIFSTLCISLTFGQEIGMTPKKPKLGFTLSTFGSSDLIRFQQLAGAPSTDSRRYLTIGANLLLPLNKTLDFETGLEFSSYSITIYPNVPPGGAHQSIFTNLNSFNIPLTVRVNFWKFFYVNGGLSINMDVSNENGIEPQTGIGVLLGGAWKYDFNSGWSIFINPYTKLNPLVSFAISNSPLRLLESGCRAGVMFPLR